MSNIFAELQSLTTVDSSITESRKDLARIVEIYKNAPNQMQEQEFFAQLRKLDVNILLDADGFMCSEDYPTNILPEELQHDSYGFCQGQRVIYYGRYVLPIKDPNGNVAGFVGYDKFEEPKYLDSRNYGYKAKETMMFGMENLRKYYEDNYVVIVEGSMCSLFLRQNGINSMATLGSFLSPYVIQILSRFGYNCLIIPDADEAGNNFRKQAKRALPKARIVQSLIAKDVDDSRMLVDDLPDEIRKLVANRFYISKYFR